MYILIYAKGKNIRLIKKLDAIVVVRRLLNYMIEKCKRCGHIKTGIAHKVFTSCAKYKHKTYNPSGLLNNYLLKMPRIIDNEDDYARYLDDINYIPRLHNDYIDNIYQEVKVNVEH